MANLVYNLLFKRTSSFIFCSIMAAFAVETYVGVLADRIYNSVNRGLLWDHIKDKYRKEED